MRRNREVLLSFFVILFPSCVTMNGGGMVVHSFSQLPSETQALVEAIDERGVEKVKESLARKPDLDPVCGFHMMCEPLAWAADKRNVEIVGLLMETGADPNGKNAYDDTQLI